MSSAATTGLPHHQNMVERSLCVQTTVSMAQVVLLYTSREMGSKNNGSVTVRGTRRVTVEIAASIFISEEFFATTGATRPEPRSQFHLLISQAKFRT
jgi:hypothetical protein